MFPPLSQSQPAGPPVQPWVRSQDRLLEEPQVSAILAALYAAAIPATWIGLTYTLGLLKTVALS